VYSYIVVEQEQDNPIESPGNPTDKRKSDQTSSNGLKSLHLTICPGESVIPEKIIEYGKLNGNERSDGNGNIQIFLGVIQNRSIDDNTGNTDKGEGNKTLGKLHLHG